MHQLPMEHIVEAIKYLSLSELRDVRNAIIEREIYFKRFFHKEDIENIVSDFAKDGYGKIFLKNLEADLRIISYDARELLFTDTERD